MTRRHSEQVTAISTLLSKAHLATSSDGGAYDRGQADLSPFEKAQSLIGSWRSRGRQGLYRQLLCCPSRLLLHSGCHFC